MNVVGGQGSIGLARGGRVLITVPCLALPGGVASYYRALRPFLGEGKTLLEIGSGPGATSRLAAGWRLLADCWRFDRAIRRHAPALVHINPSLGARSVVRDGMFLLIAKARRRRVLAFFHGWDRAVEQAVRGPWRRTFKSVYGRADLVVVLAEEFRAVLQSLGFRMPIVVETTIAQGPALDLPANREANVKTPGERCEILFLSRLDHGKGLLEAVATVPLLVERGLSVHLTVAGDGPERVAAEAIVQERRMSSYVTFLGYVEGDKKDEAFRKADIFFFPSRYGEGMPLAVLEAMAYELPIVTRGVGGIRDFFEDGKMGFVTDSTEPEVLADFLGRLITDPVMRRSMGASNRAYALERFAPPVVADRLLGLYERVTAGSSG